MLAAYGNVNPQGGVEMGPTGTFGSGPGNATPGFTWEPSGDLIGAEGIARALQNGRGDLMQGTINHKGRLMIQHTYHVARWADCSEQYIRPGMPIWAIKETPTRFRESYLMQLSKFQSVLYQSYMDFHMLLREQNPEALRFNNYLKTYGETILETYNKALEIGDLEMFQETYAKEMPDIKKYYEMAQHDVFCYQSRFGIEHKTGMLGVVINTNQSSDIGHDNPAFKREHGTVVNVGLQGHLEVTNIFGPLRTVDTGARLAFVTRRVQVVNMDGDVEYKHFRIEPWGSMVLDNPTNQDTYYIDPSGRGVRGLVDKLGVVAFPPQGHYSDGYREIAANLGPLISEEEASNAHHVLPSMRVNVGFKY